MNFIKSIIKKIIIKLLSPVLLEINRIEEIQNNIIMKNDSSNEIINKILDQTNNINNLYEEILEQNRHIDIRIEEIKNNGTQDTINQLQERIKFIEDSNNEFNDNLEKISLSISRRYSINIIRVVFLIHNVESWYTMQPIYEYMLQDSAFNPIIISVPRNYNSHDGTYEDKSTEYLGKKYKNVISFKSYKSIPNDIIYILNPDIIFRQSPWDDDIPDVFRTENIKQFRVCYIPYAINSLPSTELSFNQSLHKYAWRIYCESEFHKEGYRKNNLVADSNVIVSGYTKFEQMNKIINEDYKDLVWPIKRKIRPSLRILWAPHHSLEDWFGFSTFHIIYEKMYDFALNNSDIEIVLRPHPALTEVMNNSGLIKRDKLEEYYERFNNLENGYVDFNEEYINLFKYSDLLISDGVSFLFEYLITGKPIIHTDSKKNVGFNEFGKQFEKSWYKAYSFDDLKEYIYMIKEKNDSLLEERLNFKKKLFDFSEENKPSKIIINDLKSSIFNK